MAKIRVIHFVDRIGRGGTQAVLFDWLKHIDREKIQFDFLVFMDGQQEYIEKFKELGCNIYQLPALKIKKLPRFMAELNRFFREHTYDVAHGHTKSKNVFFLYAAMKHGVPVRIAHSHNTKFQRMAALGEVMKPLLKWVSTDLVACSDIAGIWLFGKKAYDQGKITVVKNGVDTGKFQYDGNVRRQYRKDLGLENAVVYGHVGKYMEQKNHPFLLEIFAQIRRLQPEAKLLLVGGGYEDVIQAVNAKIRELALEDSVIQLGLRPDVPSLVQAMDVFLLPSFYEGMPVVGVEAQAAGLPLLLSDTITKEVGLLPSTKYMSLSQAAAQWAQEAVGLYENFRDNREEASRSVYDQGYDSKLVARDLTRLYEEKVKSCTEI